MDSNVIPVIVWSLFVFFLVWLFYSSGKKNKEEQKKKIQALIASTQLMVDKINIDRKFQPLEIQGINLQKNEFPVLAVNSIYYEYKSERINRGMGTRVKVGGLPVYLGRSTSRSVDKLRESATGELYLTNKRLIFIGSPKTFTASIGDIVYIENAIDNITVTTQKRQKPVLFKVDNGFSWYVIFNVLSQWKIDSVETPGAISLT